MLIELGIAIFEIEKADPLESGMRGIRTASPSKGPVKIVASITFSIVFFYGKSRAIGKL